MITKIRAFDMNSKQMINSIVSIDFEFGYITFEVEGSINRKTYFREVTFMQSTGVYDKHGIEIFKGDIVKIIYDGKLFIGIVVYDLGEADFKATNNREDYGNNFQYLTVGESIEVIGNVHQHPELIEVVDG